MRGNPIPPLPGQRPLRKTGTDGTFPDFVKTWNAYTYVGNNPLSYTDPSGMFIEAAGPLSAAGPVGTIVGGLIDLGEVFGALFGLFGGGGGSPPPPNWANVQQISVTNYNPASGEPWNQQLPQIGTILGLPGVLGSNQSGSNGPWSEQPPFPLSPTSPSWVPYSNGFLPVAAGVGALGGGAVCVGSGVCEVVGIAIAAGTVAYGAYELGKLIGPHVTLIGRLQSNEWTDWARTQVQAGTYKTVCDALAAAAATAKDSATRLKIKQAQKFAGCANTGKVR